MTSQEREATLAIALMAALADGAQDAREQAELRRIASSLAPEAADRLDALVEEIRTGRLTPTIVAATLTSPEGRQAAFELAVGVCDADGAHGEAEARFLERLRDALGLDAAAAAAYRREAGALVSAPLGPRAGPAAGPAGRAAPDGAALDKTILDAAILNGALELLPQSLATLAIIPLQMRLVYRLGQAHGYELDAGHVKDFLATAGVGLASQYVEQVGRKLVGGLLGRLAGGLLGGLAGAATGSAVSFASTYALGQVAKRYYASGRTLTADAVRQAFQATLADGRALQQRYTGAIQEQARTVDVSKLASLVRG
ncbi:MAG: TerB family tellurite resistance protein [Anaeromyxobacter sp.]|nr:TerB family tellurite resistance protein [Anaeromyxobacter sp.]MBL0275243.1 TerB family tellurite resistance protein [Anaeromyxobacter sp.]